MPGIGNKVKLAWLKGMEAIGKGASTMAEGAHQKMAEINLETRRREILSEFTMRAYDLWQKGEAFPEPLGSMLSELNDLEERLSVLRAQRYARVEESDQAEAEAPQENEPTEETTAEAQEPCAAEEAPQAEEAADEPAEPQAEQQEEKNEESHEENHDMGEGDNA